MGGGDLNLKKSWHPMLMSNQKRVWEEEQKALAERKKIDQMMKERAEERNLQELQELQEAAGGKSRQQRVDWMYSGPSSNQAGTTEEMEGYLLGKRRIDGLLKGTDNQKLEKSAAEESFMAVQNANSLRDTAAKIREDPMLAIKRQEQAAYEAMMNDPVRRKMLLKAAGHTESDRDEKRRKHRHRHRDDRDSERHHHRRSHSHRYRDHDDNHDERSSGREHRRRRSPSTSDGDKAHRRRSRRSKLPAKEHSHSRREYTDDRHRSRSPYRSQPETRGPRISQGRFDRKPSRRQMSTSRSRSPSRTRSRSASRSPRRRDRSDGANDTAARLAAMQQDAQTLDDQRQQRLKAMEVRDQAESERVKAERAHTAKYGGRANFVDRMHQQAGDISLGDRIGRSGQRKISVDD